jgi:hypothetical protein
MQFVPHSILRAEQITNIAQQHIETRTDPNDMICEHSKTHTHTLLVAVQHTRFFSMLCAEAKIAPAEPQALIAYICGLDDPEKTEGLFWAIRDGLEAVPQSPDKEVIWEAAAALYYLCARRLIKRAPKLADYLFKSVNIPDNPEAGRILASLVSAAMLGGVLEFDNQAPKHTFAIQPGYNAERFEDEIEKAIYGAIFAGREDTPDILQNGLSFQDPRMKLAYSRLKVHIREIRRRRHRALTIVVDENHINIQAAGNVAFRLEVPFVLTSSDIMDEIFGMPPTDLIASLENFWQDEKELRSPTPPPVPPIFHPHEESAMNKYNIQATHVTIQEGESAHSIVHHGIDAERLVSLLQTLLTAIQQSELSAKVHWQSQIAEVLAEQGKPDTPPQAWRDKTRKLLEDLKTAAGAVTGVKSAVEAVLPLLLGL